jgi:predicted phage baseplate assembly protein
VRVLKEALPYITEVANPTRAYGGRDAEDIERAKLRAQSLLRVRDRAVTAEDFEFLAKQATSGVGRARCVPSKHPGTVRVLLIPRLDERVRLPRPRDLQVKPETIATVRAYLDERRILTSLLEVGEPEYVYVSSTLSLIAAPGVDPEVVALRVRERLEDHLHPLYGGQDGAGWHFRRTLTLADIYAQVQTVPGVAFLTDVKLFRSTVLNAEQGRLGEESEVPLAEGLRLAEGEMLCTREHRVTVRSMSMLEVSA